MFKFRKKSQAIPAVKSDPIVCRITIYNHAIRTYIAQHDIKQSERYLIGSLRAQYPSSTYRVEVLYY